MEGGPLRDKSDQTRDRRSDKCEFRREHSGAMQVHDPHIGAEGFLFGSEQGQKSNYNYGDEEQYKWRFKFWHCTILLYKKNAPPQRHRER